MTRFGLDCFLKEYPAALRGKHIGVVCHAASVTGSYSHIVDALAQHPQCSLSAIFGPQHGIFGQTQDNMVEWEGELHPVLKIPVYSLYGQNRKPTQQMLEGLDALVFDLQDVGARPYTYIWTLKLCIAACAEASIPLYVLDRPNPIGCINFDGPILDPAYFSFVGGAEIPLCHRMTSGEIAQFLQKTYFKEAELTVVWMEGWWRNSLWSDTGLPWVLPSPNMPTLDTAIVYPGAVLFEATNMSEGRGTTRPFELVGAPYLNEHYIKELFKFELAGCIFREHGFIPTFQKWQGTYCYGVQTHVTNPRAFEPVATTVALLQAARTVGSSSFAFKDPPYEYETVKLPFDILAGSDKLRAMLVSNVPLSEIKQHWKSERVAFEDIFVSIAHYPEERA